MSGAAIFEITGERSRPLRRLPIGSTDGAAHGFGEFQLARTSAHENDDLLS
jgi:hypothetical protein